MADAVVQVRELSKRYPKPDRSRLILLRAWLLFGFRLEGDILAALAICVPYLVVLYGFGFAFCALVLAMAFTVPAGYGVFLLVERHCRRSGTLGMH